MANLKEIPLAMVARYSRDQIAALGDEIYEQRVLPQLGPEDRGKLALIDIESGDFEVDRNEVAASDRLLARHPRAVVWTRQVGSEFARRFGPRSRHRAA